MELIISVIHLVTCIGIVALVLLQQGKGSDIGAAFGSGASNTVFGSPGSASFLLKLTGFAGLVFFASSIFLGYDAAKISRQQQKLQDMAMPMAPTTTDGQPATNPLNNTIPLPQQPSNDSTQQ